MSSMILITNQPCRVSGEPNGNEVLSCEDETILAIFRPNTT